MLAFGLSSSSPRRGKSRTYLTLTILANAILAARGASWLAYHFEGAVPPPSTPREAPQPRPSTAYRNPISLAREWQEMLARAGPPTPLRPRLTLPQPRSPQPVRSVPRSAGCSLCHCVPTAWRNGACPACPCTACPSRVLSTVVRPSRHKGVPAALLSGPVLPSRSVNRRDG